MHQTALAARVTDEDLAHYREHGFAVLRGVIPEALTVAAQTLIEPWVDAAITTWQTDGRLTADFREHDFWHRFLMAWRAAGEPHFRRSPNHFLITAPMYAFVRSRVLLDIAAQVLGTPDVSVHGIFNSRPQLPLHEPTQTPWHQDSQYWNYGSYGEEMDLDRKTHVVTMWMPLQHVDAQSGTLELLSRRDTNDRLFDHEPADHDRTGFLRIRPESLAGYRSIPVTLERGDLLVFNQRTAHGAMTNATDHIRWSVDVRYEATATATVVGKKYGFVAQSVSDPASETPLAEWLAKRTAPSPHAPRPLPESV